MPMIRGQIGGQACEAAHEPKAFVPTASRRRSLHLRADTARPLRQKSGAPSEALSQDPLG